MRTQIIFLAFLTISFNGFVQDISFFNVDEIFSIGTQSNRTASITLFDIDNDGNLHALVANGRNWAEQNFLFYNDGKGGSKTVLTIGKFMDSSYSMKSADIDNDGFLDIVVGNLGFKNSIYFGNTSLNFKRVYDYNIERSTLSIKVVDLNKDGCLDKVEGISEERNYVYLGLEDGQYIEIGLPEDLKYDTYNGLGYVAVANLKTELWI